MADKNIWRISCDQAELLRIYLNAPTNVKEGLLESLQYVLGIPNDQRIVKIDHCNNAYTEKRY